MTLENFIRDATKRGVSEFRLAVVKYDDIKVHLVLHPDVIHVDRDGKDGGKAEVVLMGNVALVQVTPALADLTA